jgi:hypothetical protein
MPERLNRWTVATSILEQIRQHELITSTVSVTGTWPGAEMKHEAIWVESLEGELSNPVMVAGRRQRDDLFDITFAIRIADKPTETACLVRTEEIVGAVEEVVACAAAELETLEGLIEVAAPDVSYFGAETKAGFVGFGEVIVPVHVRLT